MHTLLRSPAPRRADSRPLARTGIALLAASALSGTLLAATPAVAAPSTLTSSAGGCQSVTTLTNGGFESPVIPDNSYRIIPSASVDGWETTDPSGIEIWGQGYGRVAAAAGRQFAELNATQTGTLFQEVVTQPGQSLRWSLAHRGRGGVDVMDVLIGSPTGELVSQGNLTDGTSDWGRHSGIYTVPDGQTVTRFGFRAVSTGSGSASVGNFLDDISFGTGACVVVTSGVSNVTVPGGAVHVGDTLEYTVTASNQGGSPATLAELRDSLPAGMSLVPGSLRTVAPLGGARSDAVGDDEAEYDAATGTVVARLGSGATASSGGTIAAQESATFVFRAIVTAAAPLEVSHTPSVTFTDSLSGARTGREAPTSVIPIAPSASLSVSQNATGPLVAGADGSPAFRVTVSNAGPQADTGVVARITPPIELEAASVLLDGAECPLTDGVAECHLGDLPVGASRTITIAGRVAATVADGTVLSSVASVSGDLYDGDAADDSVSTTVVVGSSSDVWVTVDAPERSVRVGDSAVFDFTAGNSGPSDVSALELEVAVPAEAVVEPSAGTFDAETGRWSIPELASGAEQTLRVSGAANEEGTLRSRASVLSSTAVDPDRSNEEASGEVRVDAIAPEEDAAEPAAPSAPASPSAPVSPVAPAPAPATPESPVAPAPAPAAPAPAPATAPAPAASAAVGGRSATAPLASTGVDADRTALLAALLSFLGALLVGLRRRLTGKAKPARHRAENGAAPTVRTVVHHRVA